jgi:hypothetical protein
MTTFMKSLVLVIDIATMKKVYGATTTTATAIANADVIIIEVSIQTQDKGINPNA